MEVIPRDALDYQQVEDALGVAFFDDAATEATAAVMQSPEARAIGARSPARERIFADVIASSVRPDVDVEKMATYLGMLKNLESYIAGEQIGEELRDHQVTVFDDLYHLLNGTHASDADRPFSYARRGYIEKPPSAGKTVEYVKLLEAMFTDVEGGRRPKALVLVPGRATYDQTMGKRGKRGFGLLRDDTDLKVTGRGKDGYDTSGDVVVMTYAAFRQHEYQKVLAEAGIDVVICDEAHKALGEKTQAAIRDFSEDKILLGFTATGNYGVNHNVEELFENEVHNMSFNEAAELGIFQPVQAYLYETNVTVEPDFSSARFTQKEYDRLIAAEGRTAEGVAFAREFVEQGLQGIISCLPGDDRAHAKKTAELLSRQTVTTPDGGERPVRAAAIDGSLSNKEQRRLLKAYSKGEIDVLCYVDSLNEGWDDDNARFLINLRPTDSEVLAKQRAGRILRKNNNHPPSIIVDFVDETKKLQQTFLQIFDVESFEQGRIFARGGVSESELQGRAVILPDWMRDKIMKVDAARVAEQFFGKALTEAPEGYLSLREAAAELDKNYTDLYSATGRLQLELERHVGSNGRVAFHLSPAQLGYLKDYFATGARPALDGSVTGVRLAPEPAPEYMEDEEAVRRFRPLPEALDEGFRTYQGAVDAELAYMSEVTRWKMIARRERGGRTYGSDNPATTGIRTIIEIHDGTQTFLNEEPEFFGIYEDNSVRRLERPDQQDTHIYGARSLFDREKGYFSSESEGWHTVLADDIIVTEATADEIVKIEALANLGLPDGGIHTSVAPETMAYQSELAREMGELCLRAAEQLDGWGNAAEDTETERVTFNTDDVIIWIGQKLVPAVDFPDATILEQFVSTIDVNPMRDKDWPAGAERPTKEEHVLFFDGSVAKVEIIRDDSGEAEGFGGIHSFTMMPTGYYSPRIEPPNEASLRRTLKIIRDELGPPIDWENVDLPILLETAAEVLEIKPETFSQKSMRSNAAQTAVVRRSLAFMLALDKRIATLDELAENTGLSKATLRREVERSRLMIKKNDRYTSEQLRKMQKAIIRALPRKVEPAVGALQNS